MFKRMVIHFIIDEIIEEGTCQKIISVGRLGMLILNKKMYAGYAHKIVLPRPCLDSRTEELRIQTNEELQNLF